MILPPALQRGDKVAIISPSGVIAPERVEGAVSALRQWGLSPVVGAHALEQAVSYGAIVTGGTIAHRLADLQWALCDPSVKCILCSRGGYGAVHLLEHLDWQLIRNHPKWLIGFSDISALHAAWHRAGVMSVHASMAKHFTDFGVDGDVSEALYRILTRQRVDYRVPALSTGSVVRLSAGTASGVLLGGNLAVLAGLVGTPFNLFKPGAILLLEDIGEEIYRVERMMYQLRLSGVLQHLAGLVVGRFTRYHADGQWLESSEDDTRHRMYSMISDMVSPYDYPVAYGFPMGHVDDNVPLLLGARATLSVTHAEVTLRLSFPGE